MPSYRVLKPIEHNHVVYVPAGFEAPEKVPSGANGEPVPVNESGVIELTEAQAAALSPEIHGHLPVFDGKPDSVEAGKARAKKK